MKNSSQTIIVRNFFWSWYIVMKGVLLFSGICKNVSFDKFIFVDIGIN